MEPPYKRPRFYGPVKPKQSTTFDPDGNLDLSDEIDNCPHADKGGIEGANDIGAMPDRQYELDQMRARLDDKLKSKFEAIFEKYSRDFTEIGDEIDLRSGEIVVDNGHLLRMEDEMDAGTPSNILPVASSQAPEQKLRSDETENDESDTTDHSYVTPEDMEEDDMIFFQDSRIAVGNLTTLPPDPISDGFLQQQEDIIEIAPRTQHLYPPDSRFMAQSGVCFPHIARYFSQQRELDHPRIEPAWHAPYLPLATPGSPIFNSTEIYPDADRSPSPNGSSVWAPSMPRGRRRRDGADLAAIFKGETTVGDRKWQPNPKFPTTITRKTTERTGSSQSKRTTSLPIEEKRTNSTEAMVAVGPSNRANPDRVIASYMTRIVANPERNSLDGASILSLNSHHPHLDSEIIPDHERPRQSDQENFPVRRLRVVSDELSHFKHKVEVEKRPHVPFTQADDDAIIDCMKRAQRLGFSLWSKKPWKALAEKNPRHGYQSWQSRYRRFIWPGRLASLVQIEESNEVSFGEIIPCASLAILLESESVSECKNLSCGDERIKETSEPTVLQCMTSSQRQLQPETIFTFEKVTEPIETAQAIDPALYSGFAKGHPREILNVSMDFDIQTLQNYDDKNDNGLAHSERDTTDSAVQIQPTEYDPMATPETYASHDDNARAIVRDPPQRRVTSTPKLIGNNVSSVACKIPSDPSGVLNADFQPVKRSPMNTPISGALIRSGQVGTRPSYSFSDEVKDGDYSDEELTDAEAVYDDEPPSQNNALQKQSFDQKEAGEPSPLCSRFLGEQHPIEQMTLRRETSVQIDIVEGLLCDQKSFEVEPSTAVAIGEAQDSIQAGGIRAPILASPKIYSHTPCKVEILKSPRSGTENLKVQPAGVVQMSYPQTSQGWQGLKRQASSSERVFPTRSSAKSVPDGLQCDIGMNSPTSQPHAENSPPDKYEDSTSAQATEKKTYYTLAEADTYEVQISGSLPRETPISDGPVLKKLLRPTRPSATLLRGSSPRMKPFRLKRLNRSEEPGTPTSRSKLCQQNLSSILGPDDFGELQPSRKSLVKPALRVAISGASKKNSRISSVAIDNPILNTTLTPTRSSSAMKKGIRRSSGVNGSNASLASRGVETQIRTILQCGEKGFKCTKNFCFKCIED